MVDIIQIIPAPQGLKAAFNGGEQLRLEYVYGLALVAKAKDRMILPLIWNEETVMIEPMEPDQEDFLGLVYDDDYQEKERLTKICVVRYL